jgi:hypothetical protein
MRNALIAAAFAVGVGAGHVSAPSQTQPPERLERMLCRVGHEQVGTKCESLAGFHNLAADCANKARVLARSP